MEIQIIRPTVDEYLAIVRNMAIKYGHRSWLELSTTEMEEDDKIQFSFIERSVGDQLILQEFELNDPSEPPGEENVECQTFEPGFIPGSKVFGRKPVDCRTICGTC